MLTRFRNWWIKAVIDIFTVREDDIFRPSTIEEHEEFWTK
jgi:hypothetical protein